MPEALSVCPPCPRRPQRYFEARTAVVAECSGITLTITPEELDFEASASVEIARPIDDVWALVADITRRGEFSPECVGGRWLGSPGGVGSQFHGHNRSGEHEWTTLCTVAAWEPPRRLVYEVFGGSTAGSIWTFDMKSVEVATLVSCRFELGPSTEAGWRANMMRLDRDAALRWTVHRRSEITAGIVATLSAMKATLENDRR